MNPFNPQHYWEERLGRNAGLQGVGHTRLGKQYNEWLYRVRRSVFTRKFRSLPINTSQENILDIGSGTGFYIELWKSLGAKHIVGVDITSIAVERLKQKFPEMTFYQMDVSETTAQLESYQFAAISAMDVLFHIVDDELYRQAFGNIIKVLRPGGYFIFSDNFLHHETIRGTTQVSRSLKEIEQIVTDNGFEIVERFPMLIMMTHPIDSQNPVFRQISSIRNALVARSEIIGFLTGLLLYPLELVCLRLFRESPTTEIMVCRKPQ